MRCVCVQMHMSGKRKKKTLTDMHVGAWACGWPRWRVDAGVLRADADEYKGKRKRKKELTLLMRMLDAWACGRVACGCVGVLTQMVVAADDGGRA